MQRQAFKFETKMLEDTVVDGVSFGHFEGYAAVFGNIDQTDDIILPGAFTDSLQKSNKKPLYWQHNYMKTVGTVTCREDSKGLFVEGRINLGTSCGKDVYALLKGADIDSMSIGYNTEKATWQDTENSNIRVIEKMHLREVSFVSDPANLMAKVTAVKSISAIKAAETLRELEEIMRDEYGMSKDGVKACIARIKEFSTRREADEEKGQDDPWSSAVMALQKTTINLLKTT